MTSDAATPTLPFDDDGASRPAPPDEAARERIRYDLDHTLFVEAGAGAGKTSSLVERVVNLVERGTRITGIAAITFTEKAAAELRHRIRGELTERNTERSRSALADLDHAPIGTLHAFARRILNEFPIDAGLPPGFGVLDELESNLRFDEEWEALLDRLLAEPEPEAGLVAGGVVFAQLCGFENFGFDTGLRNVAVGFRYNWDLVEELVDLSDPPPFELRADRLIGEARSIATTEVPPDDRQSELVARIGRLGSVVSGSELLAERLAAIAELAAIKPGRVGSKANWKSLGADRLTELREREASLVEAAGEVVGAVRTDRKRLVGTICGRFTLDAVRARLGDGLLDFHDLLVHARRLLRSVPEARRMLHDRYPVVLLDEFQDTDPIQLEIAVRLTADPAADGHDGDWRRLVPLPGRLFIVGDPKQSIYRFRRADISQYLRAAEQVGADTEYLSANFRSTAAVIDTANELFARVITEVPDSQPAFQSLIAQRAPELRAHGTVHVLGADHHGDLVGRTGGHADELRRREAADVAAAVTTALHDGWQVVDTDPHTGDEGLRACRPGDVCILIPTRISLPAMEAALRDAGVPYRIEGSSAVYASREVRDLLLTLRAADDPTDELALVEALRTPLFGCSDVELWEWKRSGGTWSLFRPPPDELAEHPVGDSIARVRRLHDLIPTTSAPDLLVHVIDEARMFDVALAGADHRDVWRRLRFVVDQARAWAEAGGRGIRRYLAWAARQAVEGRVAETILPETDHDAVRIMTVHAAKGLEFPITIVAGLTTQRRSARGVSVVWRPAARAWMLTGKGDDGTYDEFVDLDIQMDDAERRRLLYVACTRAVDHLVVSLHRNRDDEAVRSAVESNPGTATSAELLWANGAADIDIVSTAPLSLRSAPATPAAPTRAVPDDLETWRAELAATFHRASIRSAIAATRLADEVRMLGEQELTVDAGLDKQPVNIDLPPWQRGRYGTSVGRAVHGTLQFCDLTTGGDIADLARSQCAAEGIIGSDRRVAALARSALAAPIVRHAAGGAEHWRELFIAAPVGTRVLEGYIDLLVRTDDGLVIVDYKTDRWSGPVQTAERIGRYRTQLAAYGAALEATLDEPVVGGVLVRCVEDGPAEQIDIDAWADALAEVRAVVG
ncbi:MAG: UvrD-helicase domain-containing protein [Actinomycetota bacterium]